MTRSGYFSMASMTCWFVEKGALSPARVDERLAHEGYLVHTRAVHIADDLVDMPVHARVDGRRPVVPVVDPLPLVAHFVRVLERARALEILDEAPIVFRHHMRFAVDNVVVVRVLVRLGIGRQGHLGVPGGGHVLGLRGSVCAHTLIPPEGSDYGSDLVAFRSMMTNIICS